MTIDYYYHLHFIHASVHNKATLQITSTQESAEYRLNASA